MDRHEHIADNEYICHNHIKFEYGLIVVHNYSSFTIVIIPFSFHIVNNIFQMKLKYNFIEIYIDFKVKSVMIYV